jgi:hypothetical protein
VGGAGDVGRFVLQLFPLLLILGALLAFVDYEEVAFMGGFRKVWAPASHLPTRAQQQRSSGVSETEEPGGSSTRPRPLSPAAATPHPPTPSMPSVDAGGCN